MAAYTYTYATLEAALLSWTADDDTAFAAAIPAIIGQGELDLLTEFNLAIFDTNKTANIASGVATIARPTGVIAAHSLSYTTGGTYYQLTRQSPDFIRVYNGSASNGLPRYYSEEDETNWVLAPPPNFTSSAGLKIRCVCRPTVLDSATASGTSWVATNYPHLLLLSCLMAAQAYLKGDRRWGMAKTEYDLKLPDAKAEVAQLRRATADDQLLQREVVRPANNDAPPQNQ